MKALSLMIITLISASAQATELGHKTPLKADFNAMISNVYQERTSLANGVNESIAEKSAQEQSAAGNDQKRVTDFVDVEIGWGKAPTVVDRRFDSVGKPIVVNPTDHSELQ